MQVLIFSGTFNVIRFMKKIHSTNFKAVLLIAFFSLLSATAGATTYFWIGDTGQWTDANHWSLTSGGTTCNQIPGPNDEVIFDDQSFSSDFPVVYLTGDVITKKLSVKCDTKYPSFKGHNLKLTIKNELSVYNKFHVELTGNGGLYFSQKGAETGIINTNGISLRTNVHLSGNWELNDHLIADKNNTIVFVGGSIKANGHTIHAGNTLINQNEVQTDFTNSTVSGYYILDLSKAVSIGGAATFNLSEGELPAFAKGPFNDTENNWIKSTVMCPNPPFQLDLNVTSDYNGSDITCKDSCDGELTIVASGTPGPFSYEFENSGVWTSQTVYPGLCHGTYTITVIDSSNEIIPGVYDQCSISEPVIEPGILVFPPPATVDPTCPDICDGSAASFPAGGTSPLTVCWNGGVECTNFPVGLCTGWNDVQVIDANGCEILDSVFIADPPPIVAGAVVTQPTCNGDCDGEIDVNPSGGNGGPHTVSWNPVPTSGQGTDPAIGFCDGPVNLTVFDVDGCQFDTIVNVIEPPVLTISASFIADALCNGSCDGIASSTPNGGTGGYTFEWFDNNTGLTTGITDEDPTTLCAGDYYVVVTDNSNCTAQSNVITINEPPAIITNSDAYPMSCFGVCDGAVDVDASGGAGGFIYSWVTVPGGSGVGASDTLSGLCAGFYEITVTDANNCQSEPDTVEVIEPTPLTIATTGTDPSCYDLCDGSASTVVGGGTPIYSYTWMPAPGAGQGSPTPSQMCAGTYDLTVQDQGGCQITDQVTINSPPQYDISSTQTNLQCFGDNNGTIDVTVNSGGSGIGYTYTWAPAPPTGQGTPNVSDLTAGNWCVTIEDDMLCDTTICFTITSPAQLTANANVISQVSCFGDCDGSADVVINGGTGPFDIVWSPSGGTGTVASGLCEGTYDVDITDDNGCTANDQVIITQPTPFDLSSSQVDLTCFNDCIGQATVTMNSGGTPPYVITWDDPLSQNGPTAINLCAGTWNATVVDQNLCDTVVPFTIIEPTEIVIDTHYIASACFGTCAGEAYITVAGGMPGYTFEWFNAVTGLALGVDNDSISNLCPGDYYASVTDMNGCTVLSDTMTITELPEIVLTLISTTDNTCGLCDGAAEISAAGGTGTFTYDWTPDPGGGDGNPVATGLCGGAYNVLVTDGAGCTENIGVNINSVALEVMQMDSVDITCFGLCNGEASVTYNVLDPPYTVEWFDYNTGLPIGIVDNPAGNPSTATGLCAGTYTAVLTNSSGCVKSDTVTVHEPTEITATLTANDVQCNGDCNGTIDASVSGGTGPYTYTWNPLPGGGQGTPNVIGLCAGNYDVTVEDASGCTEVFTATISEPIVLTLASETSNDISCFGANDGTATVIPNGGIPTYNYEWFDCNTGLPIGQTSQQATGLGPGDYECVVTDQNGCTVTSICLPVNEPASLTATINTQTVNCFGFCDGLIDVIPGGGTAPYFYQWQDEFNVDIAGQTNDTLTNVCQGIYNVEVTDFSGCSIVFGPIDMTAPNNPWDVTTSQSNISCSGSCDGTASVTVLGGNNPPYTYLWDDPGAQTNPTATGLCAGTWSVTIFDAGICDTTISFTIVDASPIFANAAITNAQCFGDCNGEITVNPSGGTPPYTVTWSDLQVGNTATGLCAGAITCSITDGLGCTKDTIINITEPTELTATSTFSNNATCGVCNGSATVNMTGGTPPYNYDWTPDPGGGDGMNQATGLCPGVIAVDVTDNAGCVYTETFAISDINGEVVNMNANDASCFGACDGDAEALYVCGDPACTNQWYDGTSGAPIAGETNTTIAGLCAGDYYVEVINNSGCVTVGLVTIDSPTQIIANETITPVACNGDSNGSIDLVPSGGSGAGYTYTWNPVPPNGQGNSQALNIGAGTWDVDIQDGSGCVESYSFTLIDPSPVVITPNVTDASCSGTCDGQISAIVSGGYGGYMYQWFTGGVPIPGETSSLITGLCAGTYDLEVTDAGGCVTTITNITISEPVPITGPVVGTDVLCFGDCTGSATITPGGGFPPYIINWYDAGTGSLIGQTGTTASNLCTGDYFAVITDNNGCSFTSNTVTINEPTELTYTLNLTDASCFGMCDGQGEIIPAGGTLPYNYEWLDIMGNPVVGGTNPVVPNMCEGNYTVEVTDDNGCTIGQVPAVINGFPEITANVFSNDATCGVPDGNATVFANGGNPPYMYQWMDEFMVNLPGETNNVLMNVTSGIYYVDVIDANGCTQTFQATISDLPATTLTWDAINHPSCTGDADGSIEITATGINLPLSYTWNPGGIIAEDPTGLTAGDYTLQITDAMGCINFYDTTLVDPNPIVITSTSLPSDCGQCNGEATVNPSGGTGVLDILWNNSQTTATITGLCSGVYEAQVTDDNGCIELEQVEILNTGGLTASTTVTAISCAGSCDGSIVMQGSGGTPPYTYFWLHDNSNSDTQNGLCAGTYFCQVTDVTGCSWTEEIELLDPNPIMATETIGNPTCGMADGSITVLTSGGNMPHSYLWSTLDVTPSINNVPAGTYTLTVTDASGCTMDFVYGLSNANAAVINLATTDVQCYNACDGTIDTTSVTGGTPVYVFQWLDGTGTPIAGETNPLITNLCEGDYMLELVDAAGCISYQSTTITQPDTILLNPLFEIDPTCAGICDGQIISNPIGGTLPFIFSWDDPTNQSGVSADNICDGTYTVTITDANGCQVQQTGTVTEPTSITISIDSTTAATCMNTMDGEIFITVGGGTPGYIYQWVSQTGADTLTAEDPTGILPMAYYLTVTDANGCIAMDTAIVDTSLVVQAFAGNDTFVCYMNTVTINGMTNIGAGANYTWYDTTGVMLSDTSVLDLAGMTAGMEYYVLQIDFAGCSHTDTVIVTTADTIMVDAGVNQEIYATQSVTIGGSPTIVDLTHTILWSPSIYLTDSVSQNPTVVQPQMSTTYYVTATDTNGCTASDSVLVEVLPDIVIPDGISPDGNGLNDTWILDFIELYPDTPMDINVYNRWGELLFHTDENYQDDWGGTTEDGKRLPAGTYYYTIFIDHEDFPDPFTGPITIMW